MKLFYTAYIFVMLLPELLLTQTITGKLVDQDGVGVPNLQVALYMNPSVYNATTDTAGKFTFTKLITETKTEVLPAGYDVSANYPNPFNPRTRIDITLPNAGKVRIELFNVAGQQVRDVMEKTLAAGKNYVDIELNGLPNGFYIARITLGEKHVLYKKLMLLYGSQHLKTTANIKAEAGIQKPKALAGVNIDRITASGGIYLVQTFTGLPQYTGTSLDLGNLTMTNISGTPCPGVPTVSYAGKTYHTVQIGTQCWLQENLDVGTMIPGKSDQTNDSTIQKYCYNDSVANCIKYGGLYQWAEAVQYKNGATNNTVPNPEFTGNIQGICPSGWHIPNDTELQTLVKTADNDGNVLKAIGQGTYSQAGNNESGFSAFLASYRYTNGAFIGFGDKTFFWGTLEYGTATVYVLMIYNVYSGIEIDATGTKACGLSVRCVRD